MKVLALIEFGEIVLVVEIIGTYMDIVPKVARPAFLS